MFVQLILIGRNEHRSQNAQRVYANRLGNLCERDRTAGGDMVCSGENRNPSRYFVLGNFQHLAVFVVIQGVEFSGCCDCEYSMHASFYQKIDQFAKRFFIWLSFRCQGGDHCRQYAFGLKFHSNFSFDNILILIRAKFLWLSLRQSFALSIP